MKTYFLFFLFVIWEIESITGDQSTDPRSNPKVHNALKESSRYHCYYKCHQNPDDCSKDARRDLSTCERLLYWVYLTEYEVCMKDCNNVGSSASCRLYVDCEHACLKITREKVLLTSKTPDELIHAYFANRTSSLDSILNIPDDFLFGAGTSAFQTEGAWNTSGKTESLIGYVMDKLNIANESHVSSDSYHQYKQDVKVVKDVGLNVYRFSMSWPRLLPSGYTDNINEDGVRFYHALLDELIKNGIEPYVLLNHFDHPISLEKEFGGWNDDAMIEAFVKYATFVFEEFGSKIRMFATFNEPNMLCFRLVSLDWLNFNGRKNPTNLTTTYRCGHNILKAHATVYHTYHERFNPTRNGMIGINLNCENYFSKHEDDHRSAEIAFQFACGWFANPIFSKSGDYPKLMRELIDEKSKIEGLKESRLPTFSDKWINYIKGAADFFAFTHYESHLVEPIPKDNSSWTNIILPNDTGLAVSEDPNWSKAPNGYYIVPRGLRSLLRKIKEEYSNPPIYISENGYANDGNLDDVDRIKFLYEFIREILNARKYDKCNIKAYFYWSLIDSYEFYSGYNSHFGLAHVDFNSPNRTRTLRSSANWLRNVIETRKLYEINHVLRTAK